MHDTVDLHGFTSLQEWHSVQTGLGIYYSLVVLLNLGFAAYYLYGKRDRTQVVIWSLVAAVFLLHGVLYLLHQGPVLSEAFRTFTTQLMGAWGGQAGPILYTTLSVAGFIALLYFRRSFAEPPVAWTILNVGLL